MLMLKLLSFQLSSALQASSPRCSTLSPLHPRQLSQGLKNNWLRDGYLALSANLPKVRRSPQFLLCIQRPLSSYRPTKIPPSLAALVIVSLSDNTGPRLFLFLLELPALVCSSTPFIMLCQGSDPSIYSIFTCAVKVVLLVTRMPTFVTEYCSFSQGQTPQSIALSLVLWRWFYLSQESPLSSLNTAVFLALSHYSSPAQSPSSSPLSPPAPEKKTD